MKARAQVVHLGMVLVAYEAATSCNDWRAVRDQTRCYLTHLAHLGYPLSYVERRACADTVPAGPDPTPTAESDNA